MTLNPLAFDSEEEFKKALNEQGKQNGWVPIVKDISQNIVHRILHSDGNRKVSELK